MQIHGKKWHHTYVSFIHVISICKKITECLFLLELKASQTYHFVKFDRSIVNSFFSKVLGRKGVDVRGQQVTETTLMQTSPIRITQHCAVIDALMTLYLR